MTNPSAKRGGAPVGYLSELSNLEAGAVIYLRMWCDGAEGQTMVWNDFALALGAEQGRQALQSFGDLCGMCVRHGRRPLIRHSVNCKCLGSDESCFANFVAAATEGDHNDAMMIASLMVRADFAPIITALANDFGVALKQMSLRAQPSVQVNEMINSTIH